MGHFLFVLNTALAFGVSALVATFLMHHREPWRRFFAAFAGFPLLVYFVAAGLGTFRLLTPEHCLVVLLVLAAAFIVLNKFRIEPFRIAFPEQSPYLRDDVAYDLRWFLALTAFLGVVLVPLGRATLTGPAFSVDDLSTHGPQIAHWIRDGALTPASDPLSAYYRYNAELVNLWFMQPIRADGLGALAGAFWLGLLVLAILRLVPSGEHGHPAALLVAALVAASGVIAFEARRLTGTGLAGASAVLAGIVFLIPSTLPGRYHRSTADLAYAGMLCGFAAGVRATFLPVSLVIAVWLLVERRYLSAFSTRLKAALVFCGGALLTGSYWYVRNAVLTGNPFYPLEFGAFQGSLTAADLSRTTLLGWILDRPTDWQQWKTIIESLVAWPASLFFLSLLGYVVTIRNLRRISEEDRHNLWSIHVLLFLIGAAFFLLYPLAPFSGTEVWQRDLLRIENRFLVLPFAIGLILFSTLARKQGPAGILWFTAALLALVTGASETRGATLVVMGVAVALHLLFLRHRSLLLLWNKRWSTGWVVLALCCAGLALWEPVAHQLSTRRLESYVFDGRPIGRTWQVLDSLAAGTRIAFFGPDAHMHYPLYGRHLQHEPVATWPDGTPITLLRGPGPGAPIGSVTHPSSLADTLRAHSIDAVYVTRGDRGEWPPQYDALSSSAWRKIYDDGIAAFWRSP